MARFRVSADLIDGEHVRNSSRQPPLRAREPMAGRHVRTYGRAAPVLDEPTTSHAGVADESH
jgi:hypothetical protein